MILTATRHHDGTSTHYYYLWRFGWVFYLMGLLFDVGALFAACVSCVRIGSGFAGILAAIAWFWFTLGASLMTLVFPDLPTPSHVG